MAKHTRHGDRASRPPAAAIGSGAGAGMPRLRRRGGPAEAGFSPLPFSPRPVRGENLHGYLRRLAIANSHVSMMMFLGAVRLSKGFWPLADDPQWQQLQALTGLPPQAFATMRWRAAKSQTGRSISFLGGHVARAHLHTWSMRFCPDCLRHDGIWRDLWSLDKVVACPVHAVSLVDACPRCGSRFGRYAVGRPDSFPCGFRFAGTASAQAPVSAVLVSRNVAGMFGGRLAAGALGRSWPAELPSAFKGISAFDYLAYLDVLGIAATTSEADDPPGSNLSKYLRGRRGGQPTIAATTAVVEAAHALMREWPHGFHALLGRLDGRGRPPLKNPTAGQAFSSAIGISLMHPLRGENGLPLPLVHEAFDAYWRRVHGPRRKRSPTVKSVVAKAIFRVFTAADLSRKVGDRWATTFHSKILERVSSALTDAENLMEPAELASLVCARSIALHSAAVTALSSNAARRALEGKMDYRDLTGWDHPDLLQPDAELRGLRGAGALYRKEAVDGLLSRLREKAIRIDHPGNRVPLVSMALRSARRPRPSKTEVLLRLFSGTLPAATLVDEPTLHDILVYDADLNAGIAARRASGSTDGLVSPAGIYALMKERHGDAAAVDSHLLQRLVRAGLVRSDARNIRPKGAGHLSRFYHIQDVDGIIGRRCSNASTPAEAAAIGHAIDVRPLLSGLRASGLSMAALAAELTTRHIVTVTGAAWTAQAVSKAFTMPPDEPAPAISKVPP